jgi:hypothetical protein
MTIPVTRERERCQWKERGRRRKYLIACEVNDDMI